MTWPKGKQALSLNLNEKDNVKSFDSCDFANDGQPLFLAILTSPGIWHREELTSAFLEKDVPLSWKRPFPAHWKTQLDEAGVTTTFAFHESKGQIWRGVPGSYSYPTWFDGDQAFFHLSKKVPPKGASVIYFLEGDGTPDSVATPAEVLKNTLGALESESILDVTGRKLRTHHRRGGVGVRRACTCGCTEAMQAIFESGEEVTQRDYIDGAVDDMIYFVKNHVARIDEYQRFADELLAYLKTKKSAAAELTPYIASMEEIVQQIPQDTNVQKENMKSLEYAAELGRKTRALTDQKDPQHVAAYMELLKDWRGMGGAQDYVLARCHQLARQLFQEAGYKAVHDRRAVALGMDIRERCRQILRNPDGYEIWPNYQ